MGKILVVDDTGEIVLQGLLSMGNNGEIIIVDNAAAISEVIKKDLLPHLPLPELEIAELPMKKEPNWKKKKYYGRG